MPERSFHRLGVSAAACVAAISVMVALLRVPVVAHAAEPHAATPATARPPFDAAFLGDSYTFGVGATQPTDGYAYLVARAEGWTARVVGLPGSGYVRVAIRDHENIAAGLSAVIAAQPRVVIVASGHNDAMPHVPYTQTGAAALRDLRALRAALPQATIVVLGPIWLNGFPDRKALYVNHAIHLAQERVPGTLWIDPIAQRWFTGSWVKRTGDDRTMINYAAGHPNNRGYRHIASLLEADLRELGVT